MPDRLEMLHVAGKNIITVEFNGEDDGFENWEWSLDSADIDIGGIREDVLEKVCRIAAQAVVYQIEKDAEAGPPVFTENLGLEVTVLGEMALNINLAEALRAAVEWEMEIAEDDTGSRAVAAMLRSIADEIDAALIPAATSPEA